MTSECVQEQGGVTTKVIGVGPAGAGLVRRMESWGLPCVGAFVLPPGAEDDVRRGLRFDGGDYRIDRELERIDRLYLVVGSSWTGAHRLSVVVARLAQARGIRTCALVPRLDGATPMEGPVALALDGLRACSTLVHRIPDADSKDAGRYAYGTASFAHAVEQNAWRLLSPLASVGRQGLPPRAGMVA